MGSTAVITVHSGIGLWLVKRNKKNIKAILPEAKISNSAVSSLADIIGPARDMRITLEADGGNPDNPPDGNANNQDNGRGLYLIELLQGKKVSRRSLRSSPSLAPRTDSPTTIMLSRSATRCARTCGWTRRRTRGTSGGRNAPARRRTRRTGLLTYIIDRAPARTSTQAVSLPHVTVGHPKEKKE